MKINLTKWAAASALTLTATVTAMAGSVTQPGETVGGSQGAPLPPGFYFIDTVDWGVRDLSGGAKEAVGVNIPVLAWSTPWKILGGRLLFAVAAPSAEVGVTTPIGDSYAEGWFNPFFGGGLAWDLGGGLGFSYLLGVYPGVHTPVGFDSTSLNQRFALSYVANGWNLTGNLIYGNHLNTDKNPDYLNIDLTATKKFGKWELGAVGFGSTDLNQPVLGGPKQSQFALGALVGYNFGPVIMQTYLTRDVSETNYGGFDTRIWSRVIIPLGDPLGATAAPSNMMYKK
jgi:Putative MetA-pathway of phenol degradation